MKFYAFFILSIVFTFLSCKGDINTNEIKPCIEIGLKNKMDDKKYIQLISQLTWQIDNIDKKHNIWMEKYGKNFMSSFIICSETFEQRVFKIDVEVSKQATIALFGEAHLGRHVCDNDDISELTIDYHDNEKGVAVGRVVLERQNAYKVACFYIIRYKNGKYILEYLGVENRISKQIRHSRPVYICNSLWKDIDLQLKVFKIPYNLYIKEE